MLLRDKIFRLLYTAALTFLLNILEENKDHFPSNFVFSGLRDQFLRFLYAYGILALVSMVAVSYGLCYFFPSMLSNYYALILRTVSTVVIAHTLCASLDTWISYEWCFLIRGYLCAVQNYAEKAEFSKCSWYPKRKLG